MIHDIVKTRIGKKCHATKFESLSDMTDYVKDTWKDYAAQRERGRVFYDEEFLGRSYSSFDEIIKDLHSPWNEGLEIVDQMLEQFKENHLQAPLSLKRRSAWSDEGGDEVCLDRLRSDQPFWRTTRRDHRPGPINITIATDIHTSGYANHKDVLWRGAASICLTELLEQAGYRIALHVINTGARNAYQSGNHFVIGTAIKDPSDPLDRSTLINAVSGWAYRTLYFASTYREDERKISDLMGQFHFTEEYVRFVISDQTLLTCTGVFSFNNALKWVEQQLEKFKTGEFAQQ